MDVTVAICTWNRARLLDQTLARFRQLRIPPGVSWELVVVDNNCTDDTPEVIARYAADLPLRGILEPKQGHSHARNRAVAGARGRLLIWTDDDVLIEPDWMAEYLKAWDAYPDASFFGGPVNPWYEVKPPAWITRHMSHLWHCWALVNLGSDVRPLRSGEYPCGANLAFPIGVLRHHPFDPAYGRVREQLSSGDEARVIDAVRAAGGEGVWVGTAPVDHFLPADRMTVPYVFEINRWAGFYGFAAFAEDRSPRFRGAPRWVWKRYLTATTLMHAFSLTKNDRWRSALLDAAKYRGLIDRFRAEAAQSHA